VDELCRQLAEAAAGNRFVLQGGDCAERFIDCSAEKIESKLLLLHQMAVMLSWGCRRPVVRIGRIAGQFSKPRSRDTEVIDGVEYPSFRGDNINGFDRYSREHDPARLVDGYFHSAATLNHVRVVADSGLPALRQRDAWKLVFASAHPLQHRYSSTVDAVLGSLEFADAAESCGAAAPRLPSVHISPSPSAVAAVPAVRPASAAALDSSGHSRHKSSHARLPQVYTSHEGLTLGFEEAMTRQVRPGVFYNLGAHFLWIGTSHTHTHTYTRSHDETSVAFVLFADGRTCAGERCSMIASRRQARRPLP
jgi:3-deoxy-7-phosphoheptulonate synthase